MIKLILSITFFIGTVLGFLYLVEPKHDEWQKQVEENKELERELENLGHYLKELEETKELIEKNEEAIERVKTAFPEDHDAPSFFLYLQPLIKKHNLTNQGGLGGFGMSAYRTEEGNHPRIQEMSFNLSLSGSYQNIKNFLRETEKLIRIISIDNLTISASAKEEDGGRSVNVITVQIPIKTYFYTKNVN